MGNLTLGREKQCQFVVILLLLGVVLIVYITYSFGSRSSAEIWPPRQIETCGNPRDIMLEGRWLAWTTHIDEFEVYDLQNDEKLDLVNPQGRAVWLTGDDLYIIRNEEARLPDQNRPGPKLYVLNLETGAEEIIWDDLYSYWVYTNGERVFWLETYPEVCNTVRNCEGFYKNNCVHQVIMLDIATGKQESLGVLYSHTSLSQVSSDLIVLSEEFGGCDIKWHQGPIQVIDLESGEYRVVSGASVSPGPSVFTVGVDDRTLAYMMGNQATVLQIEPQESVKVLINHEKINAQGLAGQDVLLYTPIGDDEYWSDNGLVALNMQNGYSQILESDMMIRRAVGDSEHVAWITGSDELYVASLKLRNSQDLAIFDSPMPTLHPQFQSPLPLPTWSLPTP